MTASNPGTTTKGFQDKRWRSNREKILKHCIIAVAVGLVVVGCKEQKEAPAEATPATPIALEEQIKVCERIVTRFEMGLRPLRADTDTGLTLPFCQFRLDLIDGCMERAAERGLRAGEARRVACAELTGWR